MVAPGLDGGMCGIGLGAMTSRWKTLDAVIFSSLGAAAIAAGLVFAAAAPMDAGRPWRAAALAFAGTLVVYNIDRLLNLERGRQLCPERTAYVDQHRAGLTALCAGGGAAAAKLILETNPAIWVLCGAVLAVGLFRHRLTRFPFLKPLYLTLAWVAITVGLPALCAEEPQRVAWIVLVFAGALGANVAARGVEGTSRLELGEFAHGTLRRAGGLALGAAAVALAGPIELRPLAWIPLAELAAIFGFRPSERYALLVLDGALFAGALPAIVVTLTGG